MSARTIDERKQIAAANKILARKGKKSRYIDAAPEDDWNLTDDLQLADRDKGAMSDIPERDLANSEGMKSRVLEQIKERGLLSDDYHVPGELPKLARVEVVEVIIKHAHVAMGYVMPRYLDEWIELTGERHETDMRDGK